MTTFVRRFRQNSEWIIALLKEERASFWILEHGFSGHSGGAFAAAPNICLCFRLLSSCCCSLFDRSPEDYAHTTHDILPRNARAGEKKTILSPSVFLLFFSHLRSTQQQQTRCVYTKKRRKKEEVEGREMRGISQAGCFLLLLLYLDQWGESIIF